MPEPAPVTVVETPEFLSVTAKLMDEMERAALVDYLAYSPTAGDVIPGSGGVRKLRWRLEGRGKRGGARVIYFYHNPTLPVFLLTAYAKNVRDDLSAGERNGFRKLTKLIVTNYGRASR
jgi:hypothetical protein